MTAGWLVALSAGLLAAAVGGATWLRAADQRRRDGSRRTYELHFPPDLAAEAVVRFLRTVVTLRPSQDLLRGHDSVVFETVGTAQGIEHLLRLPTAQADDLLAQLKAAMPGIEAVELAQPTWRRTDWAAALRLSTTGRPVRTDQPQAVAAALLATFQPLGSGEVQVLQWVVRPLGRPLSPPAPAAHRAKSIGPFDLSVLLRLQSAHPTNERDWRDKTAEPLLVASLRLGASSSRRSRTAVLVRRLRAVLPVVERPGVAWVRPVRLQRSVAAAMQRAATPVAASLLLNAAELAGLVGWPVGRPQVAGLHLIRSRRLKPAAEIPERGRVLGLSVNADRPLALSAADSLHHSHVIGPTGVGKSTLLGNLICQDVAAGRAVVVVDPKGDLVRGVLDRIPAERTGDVILLDPTDSDWPVGLNLLEGAQAAPDRVADQVLGIFHRLYAAFWGPRTADILNASLLTLAQVPGATLCELPLLLTSDSYRQRLVGALDDPIALEPFWAWYEALSPGERAAAIGPVMNKLRAFLLRRQLRNVIGQAHATWTMNEVLNRRRILLVSLARGELGAETASLIGSLVVATLWQAIQRRAVRLPAMVVIDEFQDTINLPTDLGELLAQARGFGVGLTLAHQHLGQLDARVRAAVLANARSKVVFQAAVDDAGTLAKQLGGGLTAADLMNLGRHQAYASACVGGEVLPPAWLRTLPLTAGLGSAGAVRDASRQHFARARADVEAAIAARHLGSSRGRELLGRRRRAS